MPAGIFTKLDSVVIRVRDLASARQWYEEKLGLPVEFEDPSGTIVCLDCGGPTNITLWKPSDEAEMPTDAGTGTFPIFFAEDIENTHQDLQARGVKVGPIKQSGDTRHFAFDDPEGNPLEVCKY